MNSPNLRLDPTRNLRCDLFRLPPSQGAQMGFDLSGVTLRPQDQPRLLRRSRLGSPDVSPVPSLAEENAPSWA